MLMSKSLPALSEIQRHEVEELHTIMMTSDLPFSGLAMPVMGMDRAISTSSPYSPVVSESSRDSLYTSSFNSPTDTNEGSDEPCNFAKQEPGDSEHVMNSNNEIVCAIKSEPVEVASCSSAIPLVKRPRGRPRKPRSEISLSLKNVKGRSKTGCLTCRKRKKKCDERKPKCKNCAQNSVTCEGYPRLAVWKNGKEKAAAQNLERWKRAGAAPLPDLVHSMDNKLDWDIFKHYEKVLAKRLNICPEVNNPFVIVVIPLALAHQGVMHALLSCSAAHYLHQLKNLKHAVKHQEVKERQEYHEDQAFQSILAETSSANGPEHRNDVICRALLFWLKTIVGGDSNGEWRYHARGVANLLREYPQSGEEDVWRFAMEFYQYHKMSSYVTTAEITDFEKLPYLQLQEENKRNFMSICEGLELPTLKIHSLRRRIRQCRVEEISSYVDYDLMLEAWYVDQDLRSLRCPRVHVKAGLDWICWNLYRNCVWLLLQRTIMSGTHLPEHVAPVIEESLDYIKSVGPQDPILSVLMMPVFMVGICAFTTEHRRPLKDAIDLCQNYSGNGNIKHCRMVLDELWRLMDVQDRLAWDYEKVMEMLGVDTLFT